MSADLATRMNAEAAAETEQLFVINLCASTSPMALSHPNTPELKRYTFFVSRQREDGRERFRLHMGYFASQEEAEALLSAVRDVYPAAWAGPAPTTGVPRRARMSVSPTVTVSPRAAAPAVTPAPIVAAPVAPAPVVAAAAAPAVPPAVPAAPPAAAVAQSGSLDDMSNVRDVLAQLSESAPRADVPVAAEAAAPVAKPAPAARAQSPELDASQTLRVLESAALSPAAAPTPAPAPAVASAARAAPASVEAPKATPPVARAAAPAPAPAPARAPARARGPAKSGGADDGQVRIVTPEDTQTLTDIRLDAENNAPPCFAVQLVWAVAPIDVSSLPHLAIFDAYTLYNVEGSRQGRKWFGLRLGFFSDPNSATQVAHYVRSDYPAVAVVPVATRERDHAKGGSAPVAPRPAAAATPLRAETALPIEKEGLNGFELLQDDAPRAAKRDVDDIAAPAQADSAPAAQGASSMTAREKIAAAAAGKPLVKPGVPVVQAAAGKPTGKPSGKRVVVRKRPAAAVSSRAAPGAPNPLESTLDILGASTLTLDESREIVNDSVVRKPIQKKSGSRFSKLLSRLSGG